jgi:hypothetical protein
MTKVAADCVVVGQNFPTKKIVSFHFVEEPIRASKHVVFSSSDVTKLTAKGINFKCTANTRNGLGWVVTEVFINICGKGISENDNAGRNMKPASPLRATWLIDLLSEQIQSTPNTSSDTMRKFLLGYTTGYAITDNLLQRVWSDGKTAIFGNPSLNMQYCHVLKQEMEVFGNPVELFFANRTQITMAMSTTVAEDENCRLKKEKKNILKGQERAAFLGNLFTENKDYLDSQMGLTNATLFLSGISFTTCASIKTVPHLQQVI